MTAAALLGKGAVVQMSDSTLTAFASIAEVRDVPIPQLQGARLDVTTHDSPGFVRQFVSGLDDLPAVNMAINWLPGAASHDESTGLLSVQRSKAIRVFKVTLPTAVSPTKVFTFSAQVLQFNPTVPVDNVMQATIQLQPNAAPGIASS
jgi:predicted secreted protein